MRTISSISMILMPCVLAMLMGCAAKNVRVRCDARLQPINAAAVASAARVTTGGPQAADAVARVIP